jgi:hypothetical protein
LVAVPFKPSATPLGGRAHHRLGADDATCTRAVVDDERLPETLRQRLADQARRDVGDPRGGRRDDEAHRPCRVGLRARRLRQRQPRQRCGMVRDWMKAGGFEPKVMMEIGNFDSIRNLVATCAMSAGSSRR